MRKGFVNQQAIFPSVGFSCSGEIVRWVVAGELNSGNSQFPELQVWQPVGGGTYIKKNSTLIVVDEEGDEVYEIALDHPVPFQPGDILGLLQPMSAASRLRVAYDRDGESLYYYTSPDGSGVFDIASAGVSEAHVAPLVSVEIGE